ncbi:MAG: protoporphyrinogen oxidase [Candidatus Omnitrophica bacterium CG1_02_46_14]|nr:MAG: protoporphyrinogen oxidase [Candidatus Omnitrophica bacterium CG1_02_46_14]
MKRVAIIGGGISGLTLAHRLCELEKESESPFQIMLFEAANRLGGTIETEKRDGFILEKGPDSFISDKPWTLELCKRVGLESEIIGTRNENRKSFVIRKGKLLEIPPGFYLIAPTQIGAFFKSNLFSVTGKFRMMCEPLISRNKNSGDESVGSFIRRRFGRECLDRVGQAMIAGIYTGDPDRLSILATMPRFKELEKQYGSVIRGLMAKAKNKSGNYETARGPRYSLFLSFRDGMETFVNKLSSKIPQNFVRLRCPIKEVVWDPQSKNWRVITSSGENRVFDAVCSTISSKITSGLVRKSFPALSNELGRILYESVATINFAFRREDIRHPLNGFGFVVPRIEESPLVACSFSSQKFENRAADDKTLLRVYVGGAFGRSLFQKSDQELESLALGELSRFLGIVSKPLFSVLSRYPETMVQYEPDHLGLVSKIEDQLKEWPGLFVAGSSFKGVGIADCVRDSEKQAENILEYLSGIIR